MIKTNLDKRFLLYMENLCEDNFIQIKDTPTILYSLLIGKKKLTDLEELTHIKEKNFLDLFANEILPDIRKTLQAKEIIYIPEHFLLYFYATITTKEIPLTLSNRNEIYFYIAQNKTKNSLFCIKAEQNNCFLYAETKQSLNYGIGKLNYIIKKYDEKIKEIIDQDFEKGRLAFKNYYLSMQFGINGIEEKIKNEKTKITIPNIPLINNYNFLKFYEPTIEIDWGLIFYYSTYIMNVYSFIEHVAVLTLPFWFALRNNQEYPYWNSFCQELSKEFNTYWEFWTYNKNWIKAFINTLCSYKSNKTNKNIGEFLPGANEHQKILKTLYDYLRNNFRNPIHHGISSGRNKTGLSLEVPTLKHKVFFQPTPLISNIDTSSFEAAKNIFQKLLLVIKIQHTDINKYLETGWNVPVDCTEISKYIISGTLDDFINQYEELLKHEDEILSLQ